MREMRKCDKQCLILGNSRSFSIFNRFQAIFFPKPPFTRNKNDQQNEAQHQVPSPNGNPIKQNSSSSFFDEFVPVRLRDHGHEIIGPRQKGQKRG